MGETATVGGSFNGRYRTEHPRVRGLPTAGACLTPGSACD